jgi:hypothetical protein
VRHLGGVRREELRVKREELRVKREELRVKREELRNSRSGYPNQKDLTGLLDRAMICTSKLILTMYLISQLQR